VRFSKQTAPTSILTQKLAGGLRSLGERNDRHNPGFLMTGKFADPHEDLMPWVEMTDSALHGSEGDCPANEKEAEDESLFPISRPFDQGKSGGSGGNSIKYRIVTKYHNYGNTSIASTRSIPPSL
jgi:hypothetical protein